jgi:hypothetical protein
LRRCNSPERLPEVLTIEDNTYKQQMLPRNHARPLISIRALSHPHQHVRIRTLHTSQRCLSSQPSFSTVNDAEIAHFSRLSALWWDERGEFALLHKMNPHRMRFIREKLLHAAAAEPSPSSVLEGLDVLDVGCGGGILSEVSIYAHAQAAFVLADTSGRVLRV